MGKPVNNNYFLPLNKYLVLNLSNNMVVDILIKTKDGVNNLSISLDGVINNLVGEISHLKIKDGEIIKDGVINHQIKVGEINQIIVDGVNLIIIKVGDNNLNRITVDGEIKDKITKKTGEVAADGDIK